MLREDVIEKTKEPKQADNISSSSSLPGIM
jgi:hypothetical protein